ncbi:MAG: glycosyltransferase family 4 protein, partial [Aequorivita vladivostokensis]|nr:glycosyltransferase family 4 protein [Aequorivita vladivostokensis]
WADDVAKVMENYRVQLAPLRFGAGLKGKLLDAMRFGLPSITTAVGAEGMHGTFPFGGSIAISKEDFINASVKLYSEEKIWNKAQENGFEIIKQRFQKSLFSEDFIKKIRALSKNLDAHHQQNFIGQILQHQTLQSTKYLSKWIEAKNQISE